MDNQGRQLSLISDTASGRDRLLPVQLMIPYVGIGHAAIEMAAAFAERSGLDRSGAEDCPHVLIGSPEHALAKLTRMHEMGVDQFVVRDSVMTQIAPLLRS